jgi:tRNA threonylcarbamoyladenosine biosynthesis protein TsaB
MIVLGFDCAGGQCAAALLEGDRIVAERRIVSERGHAQALMPLLVDLTTESGIQFVDIDRIAVTTGPGSFTGIRVALAAAHGLALALGIPIIGVTVFEAMAAMAARSGIPASRLLVAIESRRNECFVRLFDASGLPLGDPAMLAPQNVPAWSGPESLALAGDAARRVAPHFPGDVPLLPIEQVDVGILARIAAGRVSGPPPAPFYLRAADASPARRLTLSA